MNRSAIAMTRMAWLLVILLHAAPAAADLKLSTWNLNWLTTRATGSPGLPPDLKTRSEDDFDRLRAYAIELDADVIAIQEVDGYEPARRVFPPDRYNIVMSHDRLTQRVGVVIRRGLRYTINPELPLTAPNAEARVRSAVDVTVTSTPAPLRVLAVHLKQGCRDPRQDKAESRDCRIFHAQAAPIAEWIVERRKDAVPFVILGDFNRWMDRRDPFLGTLGQAAPLVRVTEGFANPCWHDEAFIDHILLGGAARAWGAPGGLSVLRYRERGEGWEARLSDHCPVSVRLHPPEPTSDGMVGPRVDAMANE